MIQWVIANYKTIIEVVLGTLGVFSIIAKLTPTQADDKILQTVLDIIHKLGLTKNEAK